MQGVFCVLFHFLIIDEFRAFDVIIVITIFFHAYSIKELFDTSIKKANRTTLWIMIITIWVVMVIR